MLIKNKDTKKLELFTDPNFVDFHLKYIIKNYDLFLGEISPYKEIEIKVSCISIAKNSSIYHVLKTKYIPYIYKNYKITLVK